jgi:hypothetical protein
MIAQSPALLAREQHIFAGYTGSGAGSSRGARAPCLEREVRAQAGRAIALLERGLDGYAVKR